MDNLTIERLIQSAKNQGFRFESHSTFSDRWGDVNYINDTFVSIEIEKFVWYTWMVSGANHEDLSYMRFNGRYNQLNGVTQKTYSKERKALKALQLV